MKTVLITGATGFIGSALRSRLVAMGYRVISLTRNSSLAEQPNHFVVDIRDRSCLAAVMSEIQPNLVFHLAADKNRLSNHLDIFYQSIETNLMGTLNLVESCHINPKFERLIAIGTCQEYGIGSVPFIEHQREMPISTYTYSKVAVTCLLQTLYRTVGFPSIILRPTLAYGPGQPSDMLLPSLIESLLAHQVFEMTSGEQTRDYIFIEDLVDACVAAIDGDALGRIINIGSGYAPSLRDVALLVARCIGEGTENLLHFGAVQYRQNEMMNYSADISLARDCLGWVPRTSIETGMKKTIESYRNQL